MYSDRRVYGQKPPRTKASRQKTPGQKPPDKSPREQLRENLYRGILSRFFVLDTKNREAGGPRCVTYFWSGVSGYVTKCDRGRGRSKLTKNSVTYFMDGPTNISSTTVYQGTGQLYIQLLFHQIIIFINSNFYLHYDSLQSKTLIFINHASS